MPATAALRKSARMTFGGHRVGNCSFTQKQKAMSDEFISPGFGLKANMCDATFTGYAGSVILLSKARLYGGRNH